MTESGQSGLPSLSETDREEQTELTRCEHLEVLVKKLVLHSGGGGAGRAQPHGVHEGESGKGQL